MSLDQLRDLIKQSPISQVIGHYIGLRPKGTNLVGLCPFHGDTKPSLTVNDQKGLFMCFACQTGGDHVQFVKLYKKLEYVDSLKEICEILGLNFEEFDREKKRDPKIEMGFRVLNATTRFYQKVATSNPYHYEQFLENRKLKTESVEAFSIGYAPSNNGLRDYFQTLPEKDRDQALKIAMEIGLIRIGKNDHPYDFYRERVMFPIHDHAGQVRGYSSRAVLKDQEPKYLNSGDSFIFTKGHILFGYFLAKPVIRQKNQVIIVEGNMDVIMMHQYGFKQTVGTMGTALSESCVKMLSHMTTHIYLGMDSDNAGYKAMEKINAQFLSYKIIPKIISYEPAKDPDDFLKEFGILELQKRIDEAKTCIDAFIDDVIPEKIPENLEMKLPYLQEVFKIVSPLKDDLAATERVVNAASRLGLKSDAQTIVQDYKNFLTSRHEYTGQRIIKKEEKVVKIEEKVEETPQEIPNKPLTPAPSKLEANLLREVLLHPELVLEEKMKQILDLVHHSEVKISIQWLSKMYLEIAEDEYVSTVTKELVSDRTSGELTKLVVDALLKHSPTKLNEKVVKKLLSDLELGLKIESLKLKRAALVKKQTTAQTQEEVNQLMAEILLLDKETLALKKLSS